VARPDCLFVLARSAQTYGATFAQKLKGEPDRAIADLNEAIRLKPQDHCAFYNRALVWSDEGDNARAIADYSAAIRLNPKYAVAFNNNILLTRAQRRQCS